jgi:hypothetical protein
MSQAILRESAISIGEIPPGPSESCLKADRARSASESSAAAEEMIPYSAKELKYLCTMWDEVQRHQEPGLPYKNIYIGATSVILGGWLLCSLNHSFWANLGGILMFAGGLAGIWFTLKSLRQQRLSSLGD